MTPPATSSPATSRPSPRRSRTGSLPTEEATRQALPGPVLVPVSAGHPEPDVRGQRRVAETLGEVDPLQADVRSTRVVEEAHTVAEHHRGDAREDLVELPGFQAAPRRPEIGRA